MGLAGNMSYRPVYVPAQCTHYTCQRFVDWLARQDRIAPTLSSIEPTAEVVYERTSTAELLRTRRNPVEAIQLLPS
jgi:hypothetical protein